MMLDYKKLLESLLRELIDKKIISEWYCNGAGYFWKYNEIDKRILKLEADNRLLEKRGSDILKELLDKNKRCMELEKQNVELEKENEEMKKGLGCETCQIHLKYMGLNNKINDLEQKNAKME